MNIKIRLYSFLIILFTVQFIPANSYSQDELNKGDSVIAAVDQHEEGYVDLRSNVTMILEDAKGRTNKRFFEFFMQESNPLGDKRKFVFVRPRDIKGTVVLIYSKVVKNDAQWIFLPAFKRVKRIASSNKGTPFVSSEFSYEDLASQELEKYKNRYLKSTTWEGQECDVVERIPDFEHSTYSKIIAYVDKKDNRYRKVEYFDKDGKHIKTQTISDYHLYLDRYFLPNKTVMENHKNGKRTTMLWANIKLKTDLRDNQFTISGLKRTR